MNILQYGVCVCARARVCVEHTSPSSPVKYIHLFDTNLPPTRIYHIHHPWETILRQLDSSVAHRYSIRQRYFFEEQKQYDAFLESSSNARNYIYVLTFDCVQYTAALTDESCYHSQKEKRLVFAMRLGAVRFQPAYSSLGTEVSSASESGRGVRVAIHLHVVPRLRINSATTPTARTQYMTYTLTFSTSLR